MQIDIFEDTPLEILVEDRASQAVTVLAGLLEDGHPLVIAFSGGKDSTCVATLVLEAARRVAERGGQACVAVTHSDTRVENPEVSAYAQDEMQKMAAFGRLHGFEVLIGVAQPHDLATWQAKILTGRGLPSFAGQNTDCSIDLKIEPQRRLRKALLKGLGERFAQPPVTCLGTRFDESERRALGMQLRGENAVQPVQNKDGDWVLSPICLWSTDDVWEHLGTKGQAGSSYSDFQETLRIYAHAEAQGCAIVASAIEAGGASRKRGGCGARHGCFVCQQASDRSLANMVEFDERYGYARGLLQLNKFIRFTRYDWSRRHWVGRTIREGYVAIEPDTYHPRMVRELFRYMLQLDRDELVRARQAGGAPMFRMLPESMVFLIDAYWSLNGLAQPFSAVADFVDVYGGRVRYDLPEMMPVPETAMPETRFLHVGTEWDTARDGLLFQQSGLRDPVWESLTEESACTPALRTLPDGRMIWDIASAPMFRMNEESVGMLLEFELENLVALHRRGYGAGLGGVTAGFKWYLRYGAIEVGAGQSGKIDEILRRTAWKSQQGLCVDYSIEDLLARSVRYADLPGAARAAWRHKATSQSAQVDLSLVA